MAVIVRVMPSASFVCRKVSSFEARARHTFFLSSRLSGNLPRMTHLTVSIVRVGASVAGVRDALASHQNGKMANCHVAH
jgi:hypothetical protein